MFSDPSGYFVGYIVNSARVVVRTVGGLYQNSAYIRGAANGLAGYLLGVIAYNYFMEDDDYLGDHITLTGMAVAIIAGMFLEKLNNKFFDLPEHLYKNVMRQTKRNLQRIGKIDLVAFRMMIFSLIGAGVGGVSDTLSALGPAVEALIKELLGQYSEMFGEYLQDVSSLEFTGWNTVAFLTTNWVSALLPDVRVSSMFSIGAGTFFTIASIET
jgi:hypothetical protein